MHCLLGLPIDQNRLKRSDLVWASPLEAQRGFLSCRFRPHANKRSPGVHRCEEVLLEFQEPIMIVVDLLFHYVDNSNTRRSWGHASDTQMREFGNMRRSLGSSSELSNQSWESGRVIDRGLGSNLTSSWEQRKKQNAVTDLNECVESTGYQFKHGLWTCTQGRQKKHGQTTEATINPPDPFQAPPKSTPPTLHNLHSTDIHIVIFSLCWVSNAMIYAGRLFSLSAVWESVFPSRKDRSDRRRIVISII